MDLYDFIKETKEKQAVRKAENKIRIEKWKLEDTQWRLDEFQLEIKNLMAKFNKELE